MRIASSLIAFIFLGVAAAGVVPDIARRGNSSNGGHSASMTRSGVHSHPSGSPTGSHSLHSGSPTGASDHPTPSAGSPSHTPAARRAQPTDGQSRSPASHTAGASGAHSMHPSQPSGTLKPEHSGSAGGHPGKSGSPSDASAQPTPTASYA